MKVWKCENTNCIQFKNRCIKNFIAFDDSHACLRKSNGPAACAPNFKETDEYKIFHYREIEKLKKQAVEEFSKLKSSHGSFPKWMTGIKRKIELEKAMEILSKAGYIEKKPELMTLQEANKKANIGDSVLFCGRVVYIKEEKYKTNPVVLVDEAVENQWQIIPAEPKVYNFDEWWCNTNDANEIKKLNYEDARAVSDVFDQNGQLKQWLNHKELREAVKKYLEDDMIQLHESGILEAFENLKPLKPE